MAEIDRLLAAARVGRSGAVTVVGDVGVGKTAAGPAGEGEGCW
jgi:hypothetical protein